MKKLCIIIVLFTGFSNVVAGTKTVSIPFELSATAINRALVSQFNDPNFAFSVFTGTVNIPGYGNANYTMQLSRPSVTIGTSSIGIQLEFSFSVTGTSSFNYNFQATPSITINDASITTDQVIAYLENFSGVINNISGIPDWLKTLTISLYESYQPWVYASKLVDDALASINSDDFFRQRAIEVTNLGVSSSFSSGKFILSVDFELTYETVDILLYYSITNDFVKIYPNIDCVLKRMVIRETSTQAEVYRNENLNFACTRDFANQYNLGGNYMVSAPRYTFWMYFETEDTFYIREYAHAAITFEQAAHKIND